MGQTMLLTVAVVMAVALAGRLPVRASTCFETTKDLNETEVGIVAESPSGRYVTGLHFYFHYKAGFKGIKLKVKGSEGTVSMSFEGLWQCFMHPTYWWKMHASCGYLPQVGYAWCVVVGGDCRWYCSSKFVSEDIFHFSLVGEGASSWRLDPPSGIGCENNVTWLWRNDYPMDDMPCTHLPLTPPSTLANPTPRPATQTSVKVVVLAAVLAVVVVVGVAAFGVLACRKKEPMSRIEVGPPIPWRPPMSVPGSAPRQPRAAVPEGIYTSIHSDFDDYPKYLTPLPRPS